MSLSAVMKFSLKNCVGALIGGLHIDECTGRVMSYVMVNNLAMQYNLFGRNGKRAFTQSCLFDIFYSKFYILYCSCVQYGCISVCLSIRL